MTDTASFRRIMADLKVFGRNYLRSREGVFFALIFPVILVVLFGAIFSGGSGTATVYVQNQDSSQLSAGFVAALNSTTALKLVTVPSSQNMTAYLLAHSATDGVVIPAGFGSSFAAGNAVDVTVYGNPTSTTSGIVTGIVNAVVNAFNLQRAQGTAVLGVQQQTLASSSYKYIDYLIPGLIGFSILTSPMFALVNLSSEYKRDKLFKQLSLTPLTKADWLVSKIIWYIMLTVISVVLMSVVGIYAFGAEVGFSPWIGLFVVVGPIFFVALGMLVGSVSKSVESAAVVGNLVTFPMMFLSGTFFPVDTMPPWLQSFAHVLPLFYVIDGLNQVMVYGNVAPALTDFAVLLVLTAVVFVLAVRAFKWKED